LDGGGQEGARRSIRKLGRNSSRCQRSVRHEPIGVEIDQCWTRVWREKGKKREGREREKRIKDRSGRKRRREGGRKTEDDDLYYYERERVRDASGKGNMV